MKTISIIILSIILFGMLFPQSANGQWYHSHYGAERIEDLTQVKLNDALQISNNKVKYGKASALIGIGVGISGLIVTRNAQQKLYNTSWHPFSIVTGIGNIAVGTMLVSIGTITTIIAAATWSVGEKWRRDINRSFGTSLSNINMSPYVFWHFNRAYLGAKLSVPLSW